MKTDVIGAYYVRHGYTKESMRWNLTRIWALPQHFCKNLQSHFLLSWSGEYFKKVLDDGQIFKDETRFNVIYHNCTPEQCFKAKSVWLSFRKALDDFDLPAYVLVQPNNLK